MVEGDSNHDDTVPGQVSVTIRPKEITPTIELDQTISYVYDGSPKTPSVTVKDNGAAIPALNGVDEYTVSYRDNINAGTATVIVSNNNGGNYIVNGTKTFEITKKPSAFTTEPTANTVKYNGTAQELVTAGVTSDGTVVYSVNGGNYSSAIPTATAVGTYTISCKIQGDANHSDTVFTSDLTAKIDKNTVTKPTISLSSYTFKYNGSQQKPTITVYDDNGLLIPQNEYEVTITGVKSNDMINVDTYTVKITTPATSNYVISVNNTRTFEIVVAEQETISITNTRIQVFYGDVIQLGTTGGIGGSTVTWDITGNTNTTISAAGLLTVKDSAGPITITAKRTADNYSDVSATWEFSPLPKPVTAVLTGVDKTYDGNKSAAIKAEVSADDLVFVDTFTIPDLT